jgi:hypothetical protein
MGSGQIYNSLAGENKTLEKSDVKIIGAVVTGTSKQKMPFQKRLPIKLAAFADVY